MLFGASSKRIDNKSYRVTLKTKILKKVENYLYSHEKPNIHFRRVPQKKMQFTFETQ